MSVGDTATWVATGIAIIAAFVAIRSARSAKRQAVAAEDSAESSRISADAAIGQLEIARQAEDDRQADRRAEQDRRDAPDFAVDWAIYTGDDEIVADVRMVRGAALRYVDFTAVGPNVRGVSSPKGAISGAPTLRWDNANVQETFQVRLDTNDPNTPIHAILQVRCVEQDGDRTWQLGFPIDDPV